MSKSLLLAALGLSLTLTPTGCGGGASSGSGATSTASPGLALTSISPTTTTAGSAALTLTATGTGFASTSQVEWNGTPLVTSYLSDTELTAQIPASNLTTDRSAQITVVNQSPGGGQSGSKTFYIDSGSATLTVVPVPAYDMVWDPTRAQIYATLPTANSVVSVDPSTGGMGTPHSAGIGPDLLSLSSDASHLWVSEDTSGQVQRFALPNFTSEFNIPLPLVPYGSVPLVAPSLEAAPDSPHTAALIVGNSVTIYDDATPRTSTLHPFSLPINWLQWGANDTVLYGVSTNLDPSDSYLMDVNSTGVTLQADHGFVFEAFAGEAHYDKTTGDLYSDNGQVQDPATGLLVGSFNLSAYTLSFRSGTYCIPDGAQGVVFCMGMLINPAATFGIEVFDQKTYRLLRTLYLPQIEGVAGKFIRWGNAGLAFSTVPYPYPTIDNFPGAVYLIDGSFVNSTLPADTSNGAAVQPSPVFTSMSPQSATAGSADVTTTISGSDFEQGDIVYFGKTALNTIFVNSGQLQTTIPSSDLTSAASQTVSVSNGSAGTGTPAVNTMIFTVTPPSFGLIALNIVGLDIAWEKNSGLLYAAISSSDVSYPNSIVAINPTTGQVVNSQYVSSDPYLVRTSADGTYLYAASQTAGWVTQLQIPGLTSPLSWPLGRSSYGVLAGLGPLYALDIQPAPDASRTTAISPGQFYSSSPDVGGLVIFDDDVARPMYAPGWGGGTNSTSQFGSFQWSPDGSTPYAANTESTSFDFYDLSVNASGVSQTTDYPDVFTDVGNLHYDAGTGYLYDDDGQVINPATGVQIERYDASGIVAPDSSLNRVFIVGKTAEQAATGGVTIQSFNQTTGAMVGSETLPGAVGYPEAMVRWGASGLALVTYDYYDILLNEPMGMLYILNDPNFVSTSQAGDQPDLKSERVQRTWKKLRLPAISTSMLKGQSRSTLVPGNAPAKR